MKDRDLALGIRQAVLMFVDYFEKWMIARGWWDKPLTAALRKRDEGKA